MGTSEIRILASFEQVTQDSPLLSSNLGDFLCGSVSPRSEIHSHGKLRPQEAVGGHGGGGHSGRTLPPPLILAGKAKPYQVFTQPVLLLRLGELAEWDREEGLLGSPF